MYRHKHFGQRGVRGIIWLGSAIAALLIAVVVAIGWRGATPLKTMAPQPVVTAAPLPRRPATPAPSFDIVRVDPQ
jgi:hypothetical protein